MTGHDINEEVLLLMDRLMWRNTAEQEEEEIRACILRVISQAYEEAAQTAENEVGLINLAGQIRALKDSLKPAEVEK